jgi:hypothetical protein
VHQRDVGVRQASAERGPCLPKLTLAIVEVIARSAAASSGLAVEFAGPSSLRDVRRQAGREMILPMGSSRQTTVKSSGQRLPPITVRRIGVS